MAQNRDAISKAVPTSRVERFLRLGGIASGIAGSVAAGGIRALAQGNRPEIAKLLLTQSNTLRLTNGLSNLRGAALKLGQMLSMDSGLILPDELTLILAQIRDDARHMPPKQLQTVLNAEWGVGWYKRFENFDVRPFAAASIGQVHRAKTHDGQDLAIKVQYPGVRKSIDSDVDNIAMLMHLPGIVPSGMDLKPLMDEAKHQLHAETDYLAEAQHLNTFGKLLAGSKTFLLPKLNIDLCSPQVLAMTYIESDPLENLIDAPQEIRDRTVLALIELVLSELFIFGVMQTDPNIANYRYDPKTQRIVLLDFGAVQSISDELSADFRNLALAALEGKSEQTRSAMQRIGYFRNETAQHHKELIIEMFNLAMEPLRQESPFDFGNIDLLMRLSDIGRAISNDRELAHVPPAATLFLHRKIAGIYLIAAKLKARVALRPILESALRLAN